MTRRNNATQGGNDKSPGHNCLYETQILHAVRLYGDKYREVKALDVYVNL